MPSETSQQRTLADSQFYTAQKQAEGDAYQVTKLRDAQAEALQVILKELEGKGPLAEQYIQVLITKELNQSSKWIISDGPTQVCYRFPDNSSWNATHANNTLMCRKSH
jgi:hypothetical protein